MLALVLMLFESEIHPHDPRSLCYPAAVLFPDTHGRRETLKKHLSALNIHLSARARQHRLHVTGASLVVENMLLCE